LLGVSDVKLVPSPCVIGITSLVDRMDLAFFSDVLGTYLTNFKAIRLFHLTT